MVQMLQSRIATPPACRHGISAALSCCHLPIFLFLILSLAACSGKSGTGVAASGDGRSPLYLADSLRTMGRAEKLYDAKQYRACIRCLDSVFLLPVCLEPERQPADTLSAAEGRQLANAALRLLMVCYNVLMDYEEGIDYFDSLQQAPNPFIRRYALRGVLTAKAQMLMPLARHAETLECLNQAMSLARAEDSLPPARRETPAQDSYWSAAAGITYMGADTASLRAEEAFLRVMEIARRTGYRGGLYAHAMGRLADIYLHQGQYEKGIKLCEEAIANSEKSPESQSHLVAAENLTEAYRQLELYDEALRYCAMVTEAPSDFEAINNLRGRSFLNKAAVLTEMSRFPDALEAVEQADSCFRRTGNAYFRMLAEMDRARLLAQLPDSAATALRLFEHLQAEVPPHRYAFFHYYYGAALANNGDPRRAIPLLEQAVPEAEAISQTAIAHKAARLLAECYRQTGQATRLADLLPHYQALADSVASNAKIRQLAAANIRFETTKREQENRALTAEVELEKSRLRLTLLAGGACLLLVISILAWMVMHRRLDRQEKASAQALLHQQEEQLHILIHDRQQLYDHNQDLLRQLAEFQAEHANTCNLDRIMESLQQSLFSKEDTDRFRRNFSALYPLALNHLRRHCPDLTYNEELFCMLAMLQLSNSEMARTLGISNPSVSKIRYRLRIKLGLPEGTEVDPFVRSIMKGEEPTAPR